MKFLCNRVFFKHSYHFSKRQLTNLSHNAVYKGDQIAKIKTVIDKQKNIKRVSETGQAWESVIGLEVHAQINATTKIFSSAPHQFNFPVNSNVSWFDASTPGTLPVLNRRCVEAGVSTALALGCHLNMVSFFDRKHYFYSDLPAGYQITQQRRPLACAGQLDYPVMCPELSKDVFSRTCEVIQVQLEQDSAKSLHDPDTARSLVDLNRCGAGLMEIVLGPDLRHGEEAAAIVKELILILETLDTCKARMERGELRVDANISVRKFGDTELGVRTEVKNINSVRSVVRAVEYEVARQIHILEAGGRVENETRSFDYNDKVTVAMRDKEAKQDYRFMAEPNLPPLRLTETEVEESEDLVSVARMRSALPELPAQTRARLVADHGLDLLSSARLVEWPTLLEYYNLCVLHSPLNTKEVCHLVFSVVQGQCLAHHIQPQECGLKPKALVEASNMKQMKLISASGLQEVIGKILEGDKRSVEDIVRIENIFLVKDESYIRDFVEYIINNNMELVTKYKTEKNPKKAGRAYQAIISRVNKDSRVEKVDMGMFTQILKKKLHE